MNSHVRIGGRRTTKNQLRLYAADYARDDGMRAGFEYFKAFEQDARDFAGFSATKLNMPVLVLTGEKASGSFLIDQARLVANDVRGIIVKSAGHWLMEEAPQQVIPELTAFLNASARAPSPSSGGKSMPSQTFPTQARSSKTANLFTFDDLEDASRTSHLTEADLEALRAVADWTKNFIAKPHKDLGRAGPVCPFVPGALERQTLWVAPEQIADRSVAEIVELMRGYKRLFLETEPIGAEAEGADEKVLVIVFPDLLEDRARTLFDEVLKQLAVSSYAEDGILFGPFYQGNEGAAIYNSSFRPFQSPRGAPFLLVRNGVISDWKFFLHNDEMLKLWANRYGESGAAVHALAEELRRQPWRARRE